MRTLRWAVLVRSRKHGQEQVIYVEAGDEAKGKYKAANRANGPWDLSWYAVDCWLA